MEGITTSNGSVLNLDNFNPLVGYHIEHSVTGRILPNTTNFQIYKEIAAVIKIMEVNEVYGTDIFEYRLVPIYESELQSGYILIEHELDNYKEE